MPGRTDNEIKNYWNTRIKRRQRAGLPIYPPDICLQTLAENRQNENVSSFSPGNSQHPDLFPVNTLDIPVVEFKNLEFNSQFYQTPNLDIHARNVLDIPTSTLLSQGLYSSYGSQSLLSFHASKRPRQYETLLPDSTSNVSSAFTDCSKYYNDGCPQTVQSFGFSSAYDQNPTSDQPSQYFVLPGSHAHINGNPSSSEPTWAMKLELPSLQTPMGTWGSPSSPLPSLESVDTLIQSPINEQTPSGSLSPRNSGLLDAVLYESQSMKFLKNNSPCQQMSSASASIVQGEVMDNSSQAHLEAEWEAYGDPLSPLGHSAASVFSKYTPISACSSDEPQSFDTLPGLSLYSDCYTITLKSFTLM